MQKPGKLQNKRTNIVAFVQERDAIMEGINAGLADAKAGRVHTHAEVTAHVNQKFESMKPKNILDFVKELEPCNIDPKADLIELYYQEKGKKYGL